MAGEFLIAQDHIHQALTEAKTNTSMSTEAMNRALLTELLGQLAKHHTPQELKALLLYQLEQVSEDEFVITRGC